MLALLLDAPPERQQQLSAAIWDKACGYTLWLEGSQRRPGGKSQGGHEQPGTLTLRDGTIVKGTVYTMPGDAAAQKLLLEHKAGRPAVRAAEKSDPLIQVIHRVPGKRNILGLVPASDGNATADPASPVPCDVDPLAVTGIGIGAVLVAEPEDME